MKYNPTCPDSPGAEPLMTLTAQATQALPSTRDGIDTRQVRLLGMAVSGGALVWAVSHVTVGANPDTYVGICLRELSALLFQLGVFALLRVQLRTRATGTSRAALAMLQVEHVLLALATLWTVLYGVSFAASLPWRDASWLAVLDGFWPLSMFGMALLGIPLALAGRWRGAARFWSLVAQSWAVVVVPTFVVVGPGRLTDLLAAGHLVVGYVVLGLLLVLRPQLTGAHVE